METPSATCLYVESLEEPIQMMRDLIADADRRLGITPVEQPLKEAKTDQALAVQHPEELP